MRAIGLDNHTLEKYTDSLIAQANKFKNVLIEITVFSNGSVRLEDLYNLPLDQIKMYEDTITNKIKAENNIKSKPML